MNLDDAIRALCQQQNGAISHRQLRKIADRNAIRRRLKRGMLDRSGSAAYVLKGSPDTPRRRANLAVFESGSNALLSHTSAAAMWGISGFRLEPFHTTIERKHRLVEAEDITVHHATVLPAEERMVLHGIAITSPALTLFNLASILPEPRVEQAVDSAWSLRLVDHSSLNQLLERLARRGRNGIVAMRKILDARGPDWTPPQSNLETRFLQLMIRAGIGSFTPQAIVRDEGWTGRVDFLDPDLGLVVEIQSERYHTALSDRRRDAARREHIERQGFTLIEIWDRDVFHRPDEVQARVLTTARHLELRSRYPSVSELDTLG